MGIAIRPELPHDIGTAHDDWHDILDRMTASERLERNLRDIEATDLETQRVRAADRTHAKGCTGPKGFSIARCGYSTCATCSERSDR